MIHFEHFRMMRRVVKTLTKSPSGRKLAQLNGMLSKIAKKKSGKKFRVNRPGYNTLTTEKSDTKPFPATTKWDLVRKSREDRTLL